MFFLALVACAPDEAPGDCGEGLFGNVDAPGAWWVDAGAEPGGDGSRERPLRSLAQVPEGGSVVLGAGEHLLPPWKLPGLVRGVCPERTLLHGPLAISQTTQALSDLTLQGSVVVSGEGRFEGRNLALVGGMLAVFGEGSSLLCEDCDVGLSPTFGAVAEGGADLVLRRTVIHDVVPRGDYAIGVRAQGATLLLEEVRVERVGAYGVGVLDDSQVEIHGLTILDISHDTHDGSALVAFGVGTEVWGDRVDIRHVEGVPLLVNWEATVDLQDLFIQDAWAANGTAPAVGVSGGADVRLGDLVVRDCVGAAIVANPGANLVVDGGSVSGTITITDDLPFDLAVLETGRLLAIDVELLSVDAVGAVVQGGWLGLEQVHLGPSSTHGVWAVDGGIADLSGVTMEGRTGTGLGATGGSWLIGRDVDIVGTRRPLELKLAAAVGSIDGASVFLSDFQALETEGYGLIVEGASGACTDCRIEDSRLAGVLCANDGVCSLTDVTVSGVSPEGASSLAMGVFVGAGGGADAVVTASGLVVEDAGHAAVWVDRGRFLVSDSSLSGGPGIELLPGVSAYGHGIYLREGEALLTDTLLRDAEGAGLFSHGGYAEFNSVRFQDNALDVLLQACGEDEILLPQDIDAQVCLDVEDPILEMSYYGIVQLGDAG